MFCTVCGTENSENAKYCLKCGNKMDKVPISSKSQDNDEKTQNCPYCKKPIPVEALKCKYCGEWVKGEKKKRKIFTLLKTALITATLREIFSEIIKSIKGVSAAGNNETAGNNQTKKSKLNQTSNKTTNSQNTNPNVTNPQQNIDNPENQTPTDVKNTDTGDTYNFSEENNKSRLNFKKIPPKHLAFISIGALIVSTLIIASVPASTNNPFETVIGSSSPDSNVIGNSSDDKNSDKNSQQSSPQNVSAQRKICSYCGGKIWQTCAQCGGSGMVTCNSCGGDGIIEGIDSSQCKACGGTGKVDCTGNQPGCDKGRYICPMCNGDGYEDPGDGTMEQRYY